MEESGPLGEISSNQEEQPTFLIDHTKINSIEDVRKIFKYLRLQFTASSPSDIEEMKDLIVPSNLEEEFIEKNF